MIVVLTDGNDVSSSATLESAIEAAHRAGASVYAIGIEGKYFTPGPLRELASKTGGAYLQAASTRSARRALRAAQQRARAHVGAPLPDLRPPGRRVAAHRSRPGGRPRDRVRDAGVGGRRARDFRPLRPAPGLRLELRLHAGPAGPRGRPARAARGLRSGSRPGPARGSQPGSTRISGPHSAAPGSSGARRRRACFADDRRGDRDARSRTSSSSARSSGCSSRADLPLRAAELLYVCVGIARSARRARGRRSAPDAAARRRCSGRRRRAAGDCSSRSRRAGA